MTGILILAHGSRRTETEETLNQICNMVKEMLPEMIIETAYMEFSERTIFEGLDSLVAKGVEEIKVVPYFLFAGIHIQQDIPEEIDEYSKKNTNVKISLAKTLGVDRRLAEILKDRIQESLC